MLDRRCGRLFHSYCNTIRHPKVATTRNGLRGALSKGLRDFGERVGKRRAANITAEDVFGTTAVTAIGFHPRARVPGTDEGQAATVEAQRIVELAVRDAFDHWLIESPQNAQASGMDKSTRPKIG